MPKTMRTCIAHSVVGLLTLVLTTTTIWAQSLKPFRLMFPVESVNQYHPFYIAKHLGYFAEEGLDVDFQSAGGSSGAIRQVLAGNADAALPAPSASQRRGPRS